jgi:uncharacterized membrane protein YedE/YeeE
MGGGIRVLALTLPRHRHPLMTQISTAPSSTLDQARAAPKRDWPFLLAAVLATTLLAALVVLDGEWRSAALLWLGFALGAAFYLYEFSYTAAWRHFLNTRDASGLVAGLIVIAVAAIIVVPVAALSGGYGGAIAPLGPSLIIGAFTFGIGMQLANGCGSGTLYTAGAGSGRMLVALATFIVGSVLGSLSLPFFLDLGGVDPVLASTYLGPWGGMIATLATIAVVAWACMASARRAGAASRPSARKIAGGLVIGVLAVGVFLTEGHPWSVTFGYTVWGAKIATLFGADFSQAAFWQWDGPKHALASSVLSDTSSLTDFGLLLGAMAAAAASKPFARTPWPPFRSLLAGAIGGLLMGWGARLGFGCNIGAFVGGVASGSLHGWIWFAAALGGCLIGIRLRPLFGLARD